MDWMYKGLSGHVDREEYLTGRKIDKTFELIEKEENPNLSKDEEGNALINQLASKNFVDTFCKNDLTAKMREDPLYTIRLEQQEHRKQLLHNPLKLKHLETILKKSLENNKKKHKNKKKSKKQKSKKRSHSKESSRNSSSDNESESELRSKDRMTSKSKSSKSLHSHHSYSHSSQYKKRTIDSINSRNDNSSSRIATESAKSSSRPYKNNYQERSYHKPIRSEEELKRKREEMLQNATWREKSRSDKIKRLNQHETKELDELDKCSAKGAQFIKPMLTTIASSHSIEDSIRKKRFTSQKGNGSMDNNFARRN